MSESVRESTPATPRVKVKRSPNRGVYNRQTIYNILDAAYVCQIGIVDDGQPFVLPMVYGRVDDQLYIHGSRGSRLIKQLTNPTCISVTLLDGLVFARSAFHHTMNYRSVVLLGEGRLVEDAEEHLAALKAVSDHLAVGRWQDVRPPSAKELKATAVVAFQISEASAKIRTGPPLDEEADYELDFWAGVVPLELMAKPVQPDPKLRSNIVTPSYIKNFSVKG